MNLLLPLLTREYAKHLLQLVVTFSENFPVLTMLGILASWNLLDLLLDKMYHCTRKRFQLEIVATEISRFADLKDFVTKQCVGLEALLSTSVDASLSNATIKSTKPPITRQ